MYVLQLTEWCHLGAPVYMLLPFLFLALFITLYKYFPSSLFFSQLLPEIYYLFRTFLSLPFPNLSGALSSGTRPARNLQKAFQKACPAFSAHLLSNALFTGVGYLNTFKHIFGNNYSYKAGISSVCGETENMSITSYCFQSRLSPSHPHELYFSSYSSSGL